MPLDAASFLKLCPKAKPDVAATVMASMLMNADSFEVNSPLRIAHFFGQTAHESALYTVFVENLNYSADGIRNTWPKLASRADALARKPEAIANAAYGGRNGNGPEASGDGWRYRGRGTIQITFKDNYRKYGGLIGADLVNNPDQAAEIDTAMRVALAFFQANGCNQAADADDCAKVTKIINGGVNGLADRQKLTGLAKIVFA